MPQKRDSSGRIAGGGGAGSSGAGRSSGGPGRHSVILGNRVIVDSRQYEAYMDAVADASVQAVVNGAIEAGEYGVPIVRADAPFRTGRLRDSYFTDVRIADGTVTLALKSTAPYARILQARKNHEWPARSAITEALPNFVEAELSKVTS